MPKFRKRPVVIEAEQYRRGQYIPKGVCSKSACTSLGPHVHTIHAGQISVLEDRDWVIPEPDGIHYYPIKPDIFDATYEPVG